MRQPLSPLNTLPLLTEGPAVDVFASLLAGDLSIEAHDCAPVMVRLDCTGRSNSRHPCELLFPFFETVLSKARASRCPVEVHFEHLEFFNSSTVTAVVQLIRLARAQATSLSIVFDGTQKWQALTFDALRTFELPDGLVYIRSIA